MSAVIDFSSPLSILFLFSHSIYDLGLIDHNTRLWGFQFQPSGGPAWGLYLCEVRNGCGERRCSINQLLNADKGREGIKILLNFCGRYKSMVLCGRGGGGGGGLGPLIIVEPPLHWPLGLGKQGGDRHHKVHIAAGEGGRTEG